MKLFEGFTFVPGLAMMDNRRLMVTGFYQPIKHIDIENLETGTADIAEEDLKPAYAAPYSSPRPCTKTRTAFSG